MLFDDPKMISAFISASVALVIVFISQWFLLKRSSIELKTKKLEELYQTINSLSTEHAVRFEKTVKISNGELDPTKDTGHIVKLYLLDINRDVLMYVRLYFPKLANSHQELFRANRDVNMIINSYVNGESVDNERVHNTFLAFGDALRNIEEEIIENKELLVGELIFFKSKYKKCT